MSIHHAGSFRDLKEILAADADMGNSTDVSYEIKERAHMLCCKFLGGAWKAVQVEDIVLTRMKGGMSNMLFLCLFPLEQLKSLQKKTPDKTLLRVYFNPETESHLVAESVIFTLLSERQLGPQLYGIFNGGRLEEYIVSRSLTCGEIRQEEMSQKIARKLGRVHKLNVPISKEPTYLCEALERWVERLRQSRTLITVPILQATNADKVRVIAVEDLITELCMLKRAMQRSASPVVFCHNDLQEGNILLPKEECGKDLVIIDFEYASYNYRAFDFANHFCEWAIDYTLEAPPHFAISHSDFPTVEQQMKFIKAYLQEWHGDAAAVTDEEIKQLREEVDAFIPVSHFFWGVWSMLQVELSPVKFGFAEYARDRLSSYFKLRPNLTKLLNKSEIPTVGLREKSQVVPETEAKPAAPVQQKNGPQYSGEPLLTPKLTPSNSDAVEPLQQQSTNPAPAPKLTSTNSDAIPLTSVELDSSATSLEAMPPPLQVPPS